MSKLSISRCRPALVAFAIATAAFATGCVTGVDETTSDDEIELVQDQDSSRHTPNSRLAHEPTRAAEPVRAEEPTDTHPGQAHAADAALAQQLAEDIVAGQLTEREAALVAIISSLDDDGTSIGWADPVMDAVVSASVLPSIDAEEAEFVEPGAPLGPGSP